MNFKQNEICVKSANFNCKEGLKKFPKFGWFFPCIKCNKITKNYLIKKKKKKITHIYTCKQCC